MSTEPLQIDHLTVRHEYYNEFRRLLGLAEKYLSEREYLHLVSDVKSCANDILY